MPIVGNRWIDLRTSYRPVKEPWDNGNQIKKKVVSSKSNYQQIKSSKKVKKRYDWRVDVEKYGWWKRHLFAPLTKLDLSAISVERKHIELVYDKPMLYSPKKLIGFINIGGKQPTRLERLLKWFKDPFGFKRKANQKYWEEKFKDVKTPSEI